MPQIFSTSRAEATVFRFPSLFFPVAAILALALQACLPVLVHAAIYLDWPLFVVVYWALTTRNQTTASLVGAGLGLAQDTVAHLALGLNGIAKTVIGWLAAALAGKMDTDHFTLRLVAVFVCVELNRAILYSFDRFLLAAPVPWQGRATLAAAVANALLAMLVFWGMDRFRSWV